MNWITEISSPDDLQHGLGPIWTATRIASPAFATFGPITLRASECFSAQSLAWKTGVFDPILLPAFRAALTHARRGEIRELARIDHELGSKLPPSISEASLRAGRRLVIHGDLPGDRLLSKLEARIDRGETPGHLAVVFAARCAAFSLPDRIAVGAYLFQELCSGAPCTPVNDICRFVASCLEPLGESPGALRAA